MEKARMGCSQNTLSAESLSASVFSPSLPFWWGDTEAYLQGPRGKGGGTNKPRFRTTMFARWWRKGECHCKSLARGWSLPGSSDAQGTGPQLLFLTPGPCPGIHCSWGWWKADVALCGENLLEVCHGALGQTPFPLSSSLKNKSGRENYNPVTLQGNLLQQVEIP